MSTTPQHVIFGTATIGLATFEALRRRGERVRLVNRSGTAPSPTTSRSSAATPATRASPPPPPDQGEHQTWTQRIRRPPPGWLRH
jgi:hypothetical protein